jgi:hypothetical protein
MFKLSSRIEFFDSPTASKAKWVGHGICGVEINSSVGSLTDTCTVTIPKRIVWKDNDRVIVGADRLLRRGGKVVIRLGYNDALHTRFIGYIREVYGGIPTKITLDNPMWILKQNTINDSWDSETLGGFIQRVIPKTIKTHCDDANVQLGSFRISNSTPAQAIEKLLQTYPLYATFLIIGDEPVLHIGLAYPNLGRKEIVFKQGVNIINTDNLQWRNAEEVKVKVLVKVKKYANGTENEEQYEFGDTDGQQVIFYQLNIDRDAAGKYAEAKLNQLKYTGYYGTFDTFGSVPVNKGDVARLELEQGSGSYLVKSVRVDFGQRYKQTVELGGILNVN